MVQVDFDPTSVTYEALLNLFWASHRPTGNNGSRLYKKAIFYHDADQKKAALVSKKRRQAKHQHPITSTIEAVNFSLAGASDQKYYLRHDSLLWREFKGFYPHTPEIVNSAAAAKVNGYLGGHSDQTQLQTYLGNLGLSRAGTARVKSKVPKKARHFLPQCKLPE